MIAATTIYAVVSLLNLANWMTLIIGALIFLVAYLITAPLIGVINQTDTLNLKEMLKALGSLAPLFAIPLYLIEKLTIMFQKS